MFRFNSAVLLLLGLGIFLLQWFDFDFINESLLDGLSIGIMLWIIKKVKDERKEDYSN